MENLTDLLISLPYKNNILLAIKKILHLDDFTKLIIYLVDFERINCIDPYEYSIQEKIAYGPLHLYEHIDMPQCDEIEILISNNLYENINYIIDCGINVVKIDENFVTFEIDSM